MFVPPDILTVCPVKNVCAVVPVVYVIKPDAQEAVDIVEEEAILETLVVVVFGSLKVCPSRTLWEALVLTSLAILEIVDEAI